MSDHYFVLNVPFDASDKQIKQSYRRLARRYHPDVNPKDAKAHARFILIGEAYEVLSDAQKKQSYDAIRLADLKNRNAYSPYTGTPQLFFNSLENFAIHEVYQLPETSSKFSASSTDPKSKLLWAKDNIQVLEALNAVRLSAKEKKNFYARRGLEDCFDVASNPNDPKHQIFIKYIDNKLEFSRSGLNTGNFYAITGSLNNNGFIALSFMDKDEQPNTRIFGPGAKQAAERIGFKKLCHRPLTAAEKLAAEAAAATERRAQAEAAARQKAEAERQRVVVEAAARATAEKRAKEEAAARQKAEAERQRAAAEAAARAEAQRKSQAEAAARQKAAADAAAKAEMRRRRANKQVKVVAFGAVILGAIGYLSSRSGQTLSKQGEVFINNTASNGPSFGAKTASFAGTASEVARALEATSYSTAHGFGYIAIFDAKPSIAYNWDSNENGAPYDQLFDQDNPGFKAQCSWNLGDSKCVLTDQRNLVALIADTNIWSGHEAMMFMSQYGQQFAQSDDGLMHIGDHASVLFSVNPNFRIPNSGLHMLLNGGSPSKDDIRNRLSGMVDDVTELDPSSYGSPVDFRYPQDKRMVLIDMPSNHQFDLIGGVLQP